MSKRDRVKYLMAQTARSQVTSKVWPTHFRSVKTRTSTRKAGMYLDWKQLEWLFEMSGTMAVADEMPKERLFSP